MYMRIIRGAHRIFFKSDYITISTVFPGAYFLQSNNIKYYDLKNTYLIVINKLYDCNYGRNLYNNIKEII